MGFSLPVGFPSVSKVMGAALRARAKPSLTLRETGQIDISLLGGNKITLIQPTLFAGVVLPTQILTSCFPALANGQPPPRWSP